MKRTQEVAHPLRATGALGHYSFAVSRVETTTLVCLIKKNGTPLFTWIQKFMQNP